MDNRPFVPLSSLALGTEPSPTQLSSLTEPVSPEQARARFSRAAKTALQQACGVPGAIADPVELRAAAAAALAAGGVEIVDAPGGIQILAHGESALNVAARFVKEQYGYDVYYDPPTVSADTLAMADHTVRRIYLPHRAIAKLEFEAFTAHETFGHLQTRARYQRGEQDLFSGAMIDSDQLAHGIDEVLAWAYTLFALDLELLDPQLQAPELDELWQYIRTAATSSLIYARMLNDNVESAIVALARQERPVLLVSPPGWVTAMLPNHMSIPLWMQPNGSSEYSLLDDELEAQLLPFAVSLIASKLDALRTVANSLEATAAMLVRSPTPADSAATLAASRVLGHPYRALHQPREAFEGRFPATPP